MDGSWERLRHSMRHGSEKQDLRHHVISYQVLNVITLVTTTLLLIFLACELIVVDFHY